MQATLTNTTRPRELAEPSALQRTIHAPHWDHRERLIGLLWATYEQRTRRWANRLNGCGTTAKIYVDPTAQKVRPWMQLCRSRLCPFCGRARVVKLRLQVHQLLVAMKHPKHLTLTYRSNDEPLADQLHTLKAAFAKMRRMPAWRKAVQGGLYSVEVTRSPATGRWHPHLHVVIDSDYLHWAIIRKMWSSVIDGGENIWIRKVDDRDRAAAEISKYVAKPPSIVHWPNHAILNFARAIQHQRLIQTFGNTYGRTLTDDRQKPDDVPQAYTVSLPRIVHLARHDIAVAVDLASLVKRRWPVFARFIDHFVRDLPDLTEHEQKSSLAEPALPAEARAPPAGSAEDLRIDKLDRALYATLAEFHELDEQAQLPDSLSQPYMPRDEHEEDFR